MWGKEALYHEPEAEEEGEQGELSISKPCGWILHLLSTSP